MSTLRLDRFRSAVYDRLENNARFYTETEIDRACNNAIKTLNIFTGFITGKATFIARANCHVYRTPVSILVPTRARYDGRDLQPVPFKDLVQQYPLWLTETTAQSGQVANWSAVGLGLGRKVVIHPAPRRGGAVVEVFGIKEPDLLVNDTDEITLLSEYVDILYILAAHEAMIKCGGQVARDAMLLYQQFLKRMGCLRRFQAKVNPRFFVEAEQRPEA